LELQEDLDEEESHAGEALPINEVDSGGYASHARDGPVFIDHASTGDVPEGSVDLEPYSRDLSGQIAHVDSGASLEVPDDLGEFDSTAREAPLITHSALADGDSLNGPSSELGSHSPSAPINIDIEGDSLQLVDDMGESDSNVSDAPNLRELSPSTAARWMSQKTCVTMIRG